jgi:ribonuclease HI
VTFATIARPLHQLTKKDEEWKWTKDQQEAFDKLKTLVTSEPVLAHPKQDQQFELEVDASGFAVGAVLLQRQEDGKRHPLGYYSVTLNAAECNYDIYNLELLAIIKALRNWRPLLAGSPHKVKVFSDHLNLQYWKDPHKISRRVAREVLELSEYDLEIHHIKGTANGRADALSRRPDYDHGEKDNKNMVVLPDHVFACMTATMTMNTWTFTRQGCSKIVRILAYVGLQWPWFCLA